MKLWPIYAFRTQKNILLLLGLICLCPTPAWAAGLIRDAEIEHILREYSAPIFAAAGLGRNDVNIIIVEEDQINAFVSEGKNMYLFTGLLTAVNSPGELKGVIAHETGHITGGHNITRQQALSAARGSSLMSLALGVIVIALGAPGPGIAIMSGMEHVAAASFFRHTRIEESAADQAGLTFLAKSGQSGDGMISFMETIRRQEAMSENRRSSYYRTHPTGANRIAALRKRVAMVAPAARPESELAQQQLKMMQAKLIGFLKDRQTTMRLYPKSDQSAPARYARAIAAFRAVDIDTAYQEISALLVENPDNPWLYELRGQILFENARAAESIAPHEQALQYVPHSPLLLVNLARSLLAVKGQDNIRRAEKLLRRALALEPENAFAWGQLANAYGAMGEKGKAELAIAEQAFVIGNMERARIFAGRAASHLPPETASARRADDILSVTPERFTGKKKQRNNIRVATPLVEY